jgi:Fe-S oxidoreductase
LKIGYPKLVGDFNLEILHSSELAQRFLENNKLKINNKDFKNKRITYHDPCHLGRHANLYDAPRAILSSIQGIEFIELKNNRENSICCGGGFRSGFTSK